MSINVMEYHPAYRRGSIHGEPEVGDRCEVRLASKEIFIGVITNIDKGDVFVSNGLDWFHVKIQDICPLGWYSGSIRKGIMDMPVFQPSNPHTCKMKSQEPTEV